MGQAWLRLRDNLESTATAWYLAELADRSLEERHAAEPLYALLHRAYELLDAGMAPGRVARWYEMHLADELGQRPEVDRCVECDRMLEATETFRWVPPLGGVVCGRCPGPPADRTGLSLEALKLLKAYQRLDIEAIAALRLPEGVDREVEAAMRDFMRVALERDPRSLAFLDEVRSPRPARPDRPAPAPAARSRSHARLIGRNRHVPGDTDGLRLRHRCRQPRPRSPPDGHDRLADDGDARRPAPDLPDLVPVDRRRGARLQRPAAKRPRNMRPTAVALHLDDDGRGNDIVIVEGEARIDESTPPVTENAGLPRQVRRLDPRTMLSSAEEMETIYNVPVWIRPDARPGLRRVTRRRQGHRRRGRGRGAGLALAGPVLDRLSAASSDA